VATIWTMQTSHGAHNIAPSRATVKVNPIHRLHSAYRRQGRISSGKVGNKLGTSAKRLMAGEMCDGTIMLKVPQALANND
jgi:hypothetical protein